MIASLLIAALATITLDTVARDAVELAETNFFYDGEGRPVFCQQVWWGSDGRVISWRMNKDGVLDPVADPRGGYVTWFMDGGIVRKVWSRSAAVSHTQADVELLDRELLPPEKRRGLRK